MKKGNLVILSILSIIAFTIWFNCNPMMQQTQGTSSTFNVLDNSDLVKATGALAIYVSPTGSDTNDGLTSSTPLYSLGIATQWAVDGTTIYVASGTYNYNATVTLSAAGTASQPIQILATGGKAVLNYSSWVPANETERGAARGIKVETSAQYWYIKGLELCYAPDNGCKCEGGHTTFEQCIFDHNGDGGLQIGLNKDTLSSNPDPEHFAAYTTVLNCDATRNADVATDYENADGFAAKLYCGKGNYFYGCRSWENCDDGWDCYQSDYGPVIENCWSWHNGDPSIWGLSSFNGDGNGFKLGGADTAMPVTCKNCIALNCSWGALGGFAYNDNTAPITLYNCVAITCGRPYNMQQAGNIITNCVEYGGVRPAPKDISTSSICTDCTWTLGITASAADFISVSESDAAAPRQADGSLPTTFGRLVTTSQLIDKGVNVGIPFLGAAPDLGAYECK